MMDEEQEKLIEALTKKFADQGLLIEAGWITLLKMAVPADAPMTQVVAMRDAFMAGAQHLWASIFSILDAGEEATADDMNRLVLIDKELRAFGQELQERIERGYWNYWQRVGDDKLKGEE